MKNDNAVAMSRRLAKVANILRRMLGDKYDDFISRAVNGTAFADMPARDRAIILKAEKQAKVAVRVYAMRQK